MEDPSAPVPARPSRLLADRTFRVYWAGGLISNVGTWLQNITASVLVLSMTSSPFLVGVLNLATFAPVFALSLAGGMLSDRFDRRRVVTVTSWFSLGVAALITVLSGSGALNAPVLIGLAAALGSSYALAKPALAALLPALVPRADLARATAVNTLQFNLGQVIGSGLSALLLAVSTPTVAFAVNTASFAGPLVAMRMLRRRPFPAQGRRAALRGSGLEGIRFVLDSRVVLALLVGVALGNAPVEALRTLSPGLAAHTLHASADAAGVLVAGYSVGATVGLAAFSRLTRRVAPARLLPIAFGMQGVGLLGVATVSAVVPAAVAAAPIGIGFALDIPVLSAALQVISPDEMRGRVMSMFSMVHIGLRPLFSLTAGALASWWSARGTLAAFVVFPVVGVLIAARAGRAVAASATVQDQPARPVGPPQSARLERNPDRR